jgi:hypothetical protein
MPAILTLSRSRAPSCALLPPVCATIRGLWLTSACLREKRFSFSYCTNDRYANTKTVPAEYAAYENLLYAFHLLSEVGVGFLCEFFYFFFLKNK